MQSEGFSVLEIVTDELKRIAMDFYKLAGIKIVLYDEEQRIIYSYPDGMCEFCAAIRRDSRLFEKCIECDQIGFDGCKRTGKPYVYRCHMNLAEAVAPIIENGITIGYIMLGQALIDTDVEKVKASIAAVSKKYGLDFDELTKSMSKLRVMSLSSVESAMNILSMCSCYLYVNKIIRKRGDMLTYQLKDYIDTHLFDELSVAAICKLFYISKSKLYDISKEAFGMGVTDYIRKRRLEHAKSLLSDTAKPVFQIAEQSGFSDPNYFIRIFKKYEGTTPNKYRKKKEKSS